MPSQQKKKIVSGIKRVAIPANEFRPCLDSQAIPSPCSVDFPGLFYMPVPSSCTPSPTSSQSSYEDFCTPETCRDCTKCSETQPEFCPQGHKEKIYWECPYCVDQNEETPDEQTTSQPTCIICSKQIDETDGICQEKPARPISKSSPCQHCSEEQNIPSNEPVSCPKDCGPVELSQEAAVCPNASTNTPCCENKASASDPPTPCGVATCNKGEREIDMNQTCLPAPISQGFSKPPEEVKGDVCAAACPAKQACPCHFPPAYSQFGCTGNINGNCGCGE